MVTVAIIMVMIAGMEYVAYAKGKDVQKAKDRIRNALTGLALLFSVSAILYLVNPALTVFNSLNLQIIDPVKYIEDSGDVVGSVTKDTLSSVGITCNGSGDPASIARSFLGKTSYRMGGKGGDPPYPADTKTCDGKPCKDFCPSGTVCLDCSGFVGLVAECAGLSPKGESGGTAALFGNAPQIISCTDTTVTTKVGTFTLTPGDLVGFKAGDYPKSSSFGHVWMFIGNGDLINSHGKGRSSGKAIAIQKLKSTCQTYPLRFVDR